MRSFHWWRKIWKESCLIILYLLNGPRPYIYIYIYVCVCVCVCMYVCMWMCMYVCIYIYVYTNSSVRAGYEIRSVLKQSLTGLNSEFSFSLIAWLIHVKNNKTNTALLFTHSWREYNQIHNFHTGISAMENAIILVQDLNTCRQNRFFRR